MCKSFVWICSIQYANIFDVSLKKSKNIKYHRHFSFLYTIFVTKENVKVTFYAGYWQNDQYQRGYQVVPRVPHPDINQPLNRTTSINKPIKDHPSITL